MATVGNLVANLALNSASFSRGFGLATRDLNSFAARSQITMRRFESNSRRAFRTASDHASRLRGVLLGLGAVLTFRQILRSFSGFEKGLIGVGKTADLAGEDLAQLGRNIRGIARETPVAVSSLLEIAQGAGQLGIKGVANITKFTATVAKMELATDLVGQEASTALARILNLTDTPIQSVDRLGAAMTQLGNNFATTESRIAEMATRVAQSTVQFRLTAAEVVGFGAAMDAMGIQAEAGGTQLQLAFTEINNAVRQGGKQLELLENITGRTGEALREDFLGGQAGAVFIEFLQGLNRIDKTGGDVNATLADMGLEGARAGRVLSTMALRVETVDRALRDSNDGWTENIALNREALVASRSFSAQMQLVLNAVDESASAIGQALAPAILSATKKFRDFILVAKDSGLIAERARQLAAAFQFLVDKMDLLVIATTTLLGLRLGSAFGPWGIAIGGLIGLYAGLELATIDLTTAQQKFNNVVAKARQLTEDLSEATGDRTEALRRERTEILENARAEVKRAQAMLEAARASALAGPMDITSSRLAAQGAARNVEQMIRLEEAARQAQMRLTALRLELNTLTGPESGRIAIGPPPIPRRKPTAPAGFESGSVNEATQGVIDNLRFEAEQLKRTNLQREIATQLRRAEVDVSSAQGRTIADLVTKIHEATEAEKRRQDTIERTKAALEKSFQAQADAVAARRDFLASLEQERDFARAALDTVMLSAEARRVELDMILLRNEAMRRGIELNAEEMARMRDIVTQTERMRTLFEEIRHAQEGIASTIDGALDQAMRGHIQSWEDLRRTAIDTLTDIIQHVIRLIAIQQGASGGSLGEVIAGGIVGIFSAGAGGGSAGGFTHFGGPRAHGGPVRAGFAYEINERGQEFFIPDVSGTVVPSGGTGSGGQRPIVNQYISTPDPNGFRTNARQVARLTKRQFQVA